MESLAKVRRRGAQVVALACTVAGCVLAAGALLVALPVDEQNPAVRLVYSVADVLDLGIFDRTEGIKHWTSEGAAMKNALLNWGLGAMAWLLAGRLVGWFSSRP